jgi:hypothetical protein
VTMTVHGLTDVDLEPTEADLAAARALLAKYPNHRYPAAFGSLIGEARVLAIELRHGNPDAAARLVRRALAVEMAVKEETARFYAECEERERLRAGGDIDPDATPK